MATKKERIENLEVGLGGVQESVYRLVQSMTEKFGYLEGTLNLLSDLLLTNKESANHRSYERGGSSRSHGEETEGGRQVFSSKTARLEFPRYGGEDPTEWLNKVANSFITKRLHMNRRFHWQPFI